MGCAGNRMEPIRGNDGTAGTDRWGRDPAEWESTHAALGWHVAIRCTPPTEAEKLHTSDKVFIEAYPPYTKAFRIHTRKNRNA